MAPAPILALFRSIAEGRQDLDVTTFGDAQVSWMLDRGLGPLLRRATEHALPTPYQPAFLAADFTARVIAGALSDATAEVLDAAKKHSIAITLLKGIAISHDVYIEPHLRTMGDVDLLVDSVDQPHLEKLLHDLGYLQKSEYPPEFYKTHHHSMPFYHEERSVCIELHTALFPGYARVANDRLFSVDSLKQHRVATSLAEHPTFRLRPELQIAYISSHMAEQLTFSREPLAFVDLILLTRRYRDILDWNVLLSNSENSLVTAHTYLLLGYLAKHGLAFVPDEVMSQLRRAQRGINATTESLLNQLIDRFLLNPPIHASVFTEWNVEIIWGSLLAPRHPMLNIASLPWKLLFPPGPPESHSLPFLWRRLCSLFARTWRRPNGS